MSALPSGTPSYNTRQPATTQGAKTVAYNKYLQPPSSLPAIKWTRQLDINQQIQVQRTPHANPVTIVQQGTIGGPANVQFNSVTNGTPLLNINPYTGSIRMGTSITVNPNGEVNIGSISINGGQLELLGTEGFFGSFIEVGTVYANAVNTGTVSAGTMTLTAGTVNGSLAVTNLAASSNIRVLGTVTANQYWLNNGFGGITGTLPYLKPGSISGNLIFMGGILVATD